MEDTNKKSPPAYIINLFDRTNLDEGTVDILHYFSREGFIMYLSHLSSKFRELVKFDKSEKWQLYFIAQENFKAIKIGLAKNPYKRLIGLQTGSPLKLLLLWYYDPLLYHADSIFENWKSLDVYGYEKAELEWFGTHRLNGEWFEPDDRSFRMLCHAGWHIIEWYKENQNER